MQWEGLAAVASVLATGGLGVLTYFRGRRSDNQLHIATNIQTTYAAQQSHINELQEDLKTVRGWLSQCEESCRDCRKRIDMRDRMINEQEIQISNLKGVIFEHEQTIARHQRTLDAMSRREDRRPSTWDGSDERRPAPKKEEAKDDE